MLNENGASVSRGAFGTDVLRGVVGGVLMGLANLVPGISGGTMLLATGVYPRFIEAVAEVSSLRFRPRSLLLLGSVACSALLAIVILAGVVKSLVVDHRWVMYSLFIGLTLGGIPVVWKLVGRANRRMWFGALGGFVVMAVLALAQAQGSQQVGSDSSTFAMFFIAGLAGAAAMILPGVSGGYLLLLLGQYIPLLAGIQAFFEAAKSGDWPGVLDPALHVMLPVGMGVLLGVFGVSNLLKWMLERFEKPTLGVLLGLLAGAVIGLWPFQQSVEPVIDETVIKGRVVTTQNIGSFEVEEWPVQTFSPSAAQAGASAALVVAGFFMTLGVARLGKDEGEGTRSSVR